MPTLKIEFRPHENLDEVAASISRVARILSLRVEANSHDGQHFLWSEPGDEPDSIMRDYHRRRDVGIIPSPMPKLDEWERSGSADWR